MPRAMLPVPMMVMSMRASCRGGDGRGLRLRREADAELVAGAEALEVTADHAFDLREVGGRLGEGRDGERVVAGAQLRVPGREWHDRLALVEAHVQLVAEVLGDRQQV